jgi:F0F1-type ATP synthase delta subunit
MSATPIDTDLNKVIVSAVNARVEAEMMKALSGDETMGKFVVSALRQNVEVKDPHTYRTTVEPFLTNVLRKAIQEATVAAVQRLIAEELPSIEDEVRKALRRDVKRIAETLTQSLADAAAKSYGVKVDLSLLMPGRD